MASHSITIAKAAFTATCLRPDETQITRENVLKFHSFLETAISRCSPANVQSCTKWLLNNISLSPQKSSALGKYLLAYSKQLKDEDRVAGGRKLSAARGRLHILYILSDLMHNEKYHNGGSAARKHTEDMFQSCLFELFQMVRSGAKQRLGRRLEILLDTWEHEQYFDRTIIAKLKDGMAGREPEPSKTALTTATPTREIPHVMPATHGDPTIPYYDLPAANLMPHIIPNKPIPIRPDQVRALQLSAGPADENLVNAVKDFLKDVERMTNSYEKLEDESITADVDELGQLSYRNEANEIVGDTYYGWSREFCDKMKKRRKDETSDNRRGRRRSFSSSRSSSHSRSRSISRSLSKRRRYETSSRSQSRDRRSRSRSNSPDRKQMVFGPARTEQARSREVNLATSVPSFRDMPYPPIPLGPNGLPFPPPRPINYNGPWPPPPPPPLSGVSDMPFPPPPQFYPGSNTLPPSGHQHRRQ